jgi:hypothetical protein
MTPEQEHDINNALLTLMYEWKTGAIDQRQALKELKQCLKYFAIVENIIDFQGDERVDLRRFEYCGDEDTIKRVKQDMSEKMAAEIVKAGCISFEEVEVPIHETYPGDERYRQFRMKASVIIPKHNPTKP